MTIGELKEKITSLPDDMEVFKYNTLYQDFEDPVIAEVMEAYRDRGGIKKITGFAI